MQNNTQDPQAYYHDSIMDAEAYDVTEQTPMIEESAIAETEAPAPVAAEPEVSASGTAAPARPHRSARLEEYIRTTRELLDFTRKERNSLIIRIDEEEDKITHERHDYTTGLQKYNAINQMRDELNSKNNLIRALIELIRSVD